MDVLERNGFGLSRTFGRSMRPLIWGGQHCVAVVPLDGEPAVDDLLMFRQTLADGSQRNVVHRLVEIRRRDNTTLYITRGDNCLGCETVTRDEIVGRVAEVHRLSGFRPWHAIPMKRFAVTDKAYRRYTRFWRAIWPLRRFCYRVRAHGYGLKARVMNFLKKR